MAPRAGLSATKKTKTIAPSETADVHLSCPVCPPVLSHSAGTVKAEAPASGQTGEGSNVDSSGRGDHPDRCLTPAPMARAKAVIGIVYVVSVHRNDDGEWAVLVNGAHHATFAAPVSAVAAARREGRRLLAHPDTGEVFVQLSVEAIDATRLEREARNV